jgi:hypothetical protein
MFKDEFGYLAERSHNLGLNFRYKVFLPTFYEE